MENGAVENIGHHSPRLVMRSAICAGDGAVIEPTGSWVTMTVVCPVRRTVWRSICST